MIPAISESASKMENHFFIEMPPSIILLDHLNYKTEALTIILKLLSIY
jgi:hypothetical protein